MMTQEPPSRHQIATKSLPSRYRSQSYQVATRSPPSRHQVATKLQSHKVVTKSQSPLNRHQVAIAPARSQPTRLQLHKRNRRQFTDALLTMLSSSFHIHVVTRLDGYYSGNKGEGEWAKKSWGKLATFKRSCIFQEPLIIFVFDRIEAMRLVLGCLGHYRIILRLCAEQQCLVSRPFI